MVEQFEVTRQSLADQVADGILEIILDRRLGQGDQLPPTGELAEQFRVSRTVIREGLAALAGRGIVERSRGRESVVTLPGPDHLHALLSFRIRGEATDATTIIEFRRPLEIESARLAALRRSDDDVADLRSLFAELAAAADSTETAFHDADIAFHRRIAVTSGNSLIVLVLDGLVELLRDARKRSYYGRKRRGIGLAGVVRDHELVLEAVADGDPDAAAAAMAGHLHSTQTDLDAVG